MPPRPFRKAISDFSGGIVDFFSSRDLQDNQFQEVKNFSTETPGKIERIRSKIDASGDSPTNQFKIGQSGANFHSYSTEWAEGNYLEKVVDKVGNAFFIDMGATGGSADNDIARIDLGASLLHKLSVGDLIEIVDTNSPDIYSINGVSKVVNIVNANQFDIRVKFNASNNKFTTTALVSVSNVKIRYLPEPTGALWSTVFGEIGSIPETGLTTDTPALSRTPANQAQNVTSHLFTITTATTDNSFKFVNGNTDTYASSPYDMIIHTGYGFKNSKFKVGQVVTYTSFGSNGYLPANAYNATIVAIDGNGYAIHLNTSGVLAEVGGAQDDYAFDGFFSGTLFGSDASWVSKELTGWSTTDKSKPVFYSHGGVLRISDANFYNEGNKNKWFGFVNSPKYGNDVPVGKSPKSRKPDIATNVRGWEMSDNTLASPTVVKMVGWGDPTGQVINAGEIGLYVYDPREYEDVPLNRREHIMYPDATTKETFNDLDRYACTFIYDGGNESELSRDSGDNIGIDGFKVITPEDIPDDDFLVTYEDDPLGTPVVHEVKVISYNETTYDAGDRACTEIRLSAETDGVDGAHKVLKVGDVIRAGSEKMIILSIAAHAGSEAYVDFHVHRGILGTEPFDATGMNVYRVQQKQKARAVNLVLCTNDNTPATKTLVDSSANVTFTANKALGSNANGKIDVEIDWDAGSGGGNATITIDIVPSSSAYLKLKLTLLRNGYDIRDVHIVQAVNNGDVTSGAGAANIDVTVNEDITSFVTASTTTTGNGEVWNADGSGLLGAGTAAVNVNALDPRITGINLYWNPYGEVDWYLVNYYDIENGWSNDI